MHRKQVSVVIPIYKEQLTVLELTSLRQCITVLKNYHFTFFCPLTLNTKSYEILCDQKISYTIERFASKYFDDINGYNKLMLSPHFYKKFIGFRYILVHQLDAFIFSDQLTYWCKKNYDYIGAPNTPHLNQPGEIQFLKNYSNFLRLLRIKRKISNVGNGGLSLRKTRSCYLLVTLFYFAVKKWENNNEDGFFKYWGNLLYPIFKLPKDETAVRFAIELEPKKTLKKLNNTLPFGCHAFEKYEWETWKPFIEKSQAT
ncbi:MAG: hypothetical protein EOO87_01975 [Pedobacter sp.]|nr:MAG: hypothetical protein EOO87_01975 [Pedobacter sp.]